MKTFQIISPKLVNSTFIMSDKSEPPKQTFLFLSGPSWVAEMIQEGPQDKFLMPSAVQLKVNIKKQSVIEEPKEEPKEEPAKK